MTSTHLSNADVPTPEDSAIVSEAIAVFNRSDPEQKIIVFEGRLSELAKIIAARVRTSGSPDWMALLDLLQAATSMMAAEDISSYLDQLAVDRQFEKLTENYISILNTHAYVHLNPIQLDTSDCDLIVALGTSSDSLSGTKVIEGTMAIREEGNSTQVPVCTGGFVQSYTRRNGPCPPGKYLVTNYRPNRDLVAMTSDGISFSFDLTPTPDTQVYGRSALRIHPDGPPHGTHGCIGVVGDAAAQRLVRDACARILDATNASGSWLKLAVNYG